MPVDNQTILEVSTPVNKPACSTHVSTPFPVGGERGSRKTYVGCWLLDMDPAGRFAAEMALETVEAVLSLMLKAGLIEK
jgi:hypothetical protein